MLSEKSWSEDVALGGGSPLILQFLWAKLQWPFPKILHTPSTVGGKAAVNGTFIQRLFVKFFTDVLIESTGQEVVAVFAYECLHVGNIFINILPSGVMLLHGNLSFHTYYTSKEKSSYVSWSQGLNLKT